MAGAELILCMVRLPPGRVFGWLACAFLLAPLFAEAGNPARARWFPDQPSTPRQVVSGPAQHPALRLDLRALRRLPADSRQAGMESHGQAGRT